MTAEWLPRNGANRWLEPLLTVPVILGGLYVLWSVTYRGYFPSPFLYNSADSWADWINPAYYSHNSSEAYGAYNAIYPPLSFLFLKWTTLGYCYTGADTWSSRDCDWLGALMLHSWFVLNIFLVSKSFLMLDRSTALWRSIITVAGLPALHSLERGNLIIVTFSCFVLAHGPLLKSARLRWLMLAITINMKVYLLPTLFVHLIKRRWRWFEGAALATAGLWVVTWAIYGSGTPLEIYDNLRTWTSIADNPDRWLDVWYAVTYIQLLGLFNSTTFPILDVIGSTNVEIGSALIVNTIRLIQAMLVGAIAAAWIRPEAVSLKRLVNLGALLAMMTSEPGAYSMPLIFFLTLTERWEGIGRKVAIVTCYILAIPGEIYLNPITVLTQPGFLARGFVVYDFWLTYGVFLRPGLTAVIPCALAAVTMADVWRDIRRQGWRDRQRFRFDLPLMMAGGHRDAAQDAAGRLPPQGLVRI